jgi:ribosomal protein S18 acetylase RimI-like enzyme
MMIYKLTTDGITASMLQGFFVGWSNPPKLETHLQLLQKSSKVVLAIDDDKNQVVGFITAISDGVLSAYIPLLEVLPEYQDRGIGKELVHRMIQELRDMYMIDICCDDELVPYYEKFGFFKGSSMLLRNYDRQSGV